MNPYTVLLLRPDYIADEFGKDTYMARVGAESVEQAQRAAQLEAKREDDRYCTPEEVELGGDPDDYAVLMVIEGHHNDIKET
jgi:hypothetical protein